jgi:pyruvate kinase
MCLAGMNVARLNFSHGTHPQHKEKLEAIKRVRERLGMPIAIMLDTKGPEYRIGRFAEGRAEVRTGDTFSFTTEDVLGDGSIVSVSYKNLIDELSVGDRILVNNGLVIFEVERIEKKRAVCRVIAGGVLSDRKSMNFPGKTLRQEYLGEADKADLLFGIENGVDFIAASFVSCEADIRAVREFLDENGGGDIDVIAKIENRAGVDNIEEICRVADGIMVARGDLGVEIPFVEVPSVQKYLIKKCRLLGKRVITATEMLESMIHNPRPTRAEISDVANAVYDGSSAIMLSGETAMGEHPVEAVRNMAEIAEFTERSIDYTDWFRRTNFEIRSNADAVSHSTCAMATDVGARCIVVNSRTGVTARMVSRFRCPIDIVGITTSERVWRKLNLSWGVTPVMSEEFDTTEVVFYNAMKRSKEVLRLAPGDNVVITGGRTDGPPGNTNTIRLEIVK